MARSSSLVPDFRTLSTMVTVARAHTLAKLTRASAHEAADADMQLGTLGMDVWAVDARARLEARFEALERAEEELHQCVTDIMDTLETSVPPQRRASQAASASAAGPATQPAASGAGSSKMPRPDSLSRLLMQQPAPRPQLQSPRSPVPVHDLDTVGMQAPPPATARVDPLRDVPSVPRPTRPTPMSPAEVVAQAGTLYVPVTLPVMKAPPSAPTPQMLEALTRPKAPPPCATPPTVIAVGTSMVTPLMRAVAPSSVFLMPGVDIRYGPRRPSTPTQTTRRVAQAYGTTSDTALARDGPPFYFENGFPAGWKLVMGDLARDIAATQAIWGVPRQRWLSCKCMLSLKHVTTTTHL